MGWQKYHVVIENKQKQNWCPIQLAQCAGRVHEATSFAESPVNGPVNHILHSRRVDEKKLLLQFDIISEKMGRFVKEEWHYAN